MTLAGFILDDVWDEMANLVVSCLDWETRPSSPSSIRLISFGKLLDDKSPISGMYSVVWPWLLFILRIMIIY